MAKLAAPSSRTARILMRSRSPVLKLLISSHVPARRIPNPLPVSAELTLAQRETVAIRTRIKATANKAILKPTGQVIDDSRRGVSKKPGG
jgi:hypothetical protein